MPTLVRAAREHGLRYTMCTDSAAWYLGPDHRPCGLWMTLFIFSKIPELLDTIFLVAQQKDVIFLHWFHHVTVLLYCFHAYKTEAPQALYFVAMNYTVHAVMYGYYCLMALRMKPKWLPPIVITFMQLSQMVVGVGVQIASMIKHAYSPSCPTNFENIVAGGVMYASYFALFFKFLVERFFLTPPPQARNEAAVKKLE